MCQMEPDEGGDMVEAIHDCDHVVLSDEGKRRRDVVDPGMDGVGYHHDSVYLPSEEIPWLDAAVMRQAMCNAVRHWSQDSLVSGWKPGTERFTSGGEFWYPQKGTRGDEWSIISFMNRHGVSRDTWFFVALLDAALGHIYVWLQQDSAGEREVLDPMIIFDLRKSLLAMGKKVEWGYPTHDKLYCDIESVRRVPVEDLVDYDGGGRSDLWKAEAKKWVDNLMKQSQ